MFVTTGTCAFPTVGAIRNKTSVGRSTHRKACPIESEWRDRVVLSSTVTLSFVTEGSSTGCSPTFLTETGSCSYLKEPKEFKASHDDLAVSPTMEREPPYGVTGKLF
jgi:hypothetical protein